MKEGPRKRDILSRPASKKAAARPRSAPRNEPKPVVHHQYPSAPEIKDLRTVHASANERISRLRSQS